MRRLMKVMLILGMTGFFLCYNTTKLQAEEYEYDILNRVTKVTYEDGSYVEYEYDRNGNILNINVYDAGASQEPEAGQGGENTQDPIGGAQEAPLGTSVPEVPNIPTGTSMPSRTASPVATSTPAGTAAPGATGTPGNPNVPTVTSVPGGTGVPANPNDPVSTTVPGSTSAPITTSIPTGTAAPGGIESPVAPDPSIGTAMPGSTEAPANPDVPAGTSAPNSIEGPRDTEVSNNDTGTEPVNNSERIQDAVTSNSEYIEMSAAYEHIFRESSKAIHTSEYILQLAKSVRRLMDMVNRCMELRF